MIMIENLVKSLTIQKNALMIFPCTIDGPWLAPPLDANWRRAVLKAVFAARQNIKKALKTKLLNNGVLY
jgi:hypothetical protein